MKQNLFRRLVAVTLAVLLVFSIAGCTGKTGESKDSGSKAAATGDAAKETTKETPKEVKKTKLQVMSWWDITKQESLQKMKAKFEEANPNYELEFPMLPGSGYAEKVLTVIAGGGDVPDIIMLAGDKLPKFADTGAILPLDKYVTDKYKNSLYPTVMNACMYNGKLYAAARDVTSMVMFLNKKMFEDAKVPLPKDEWTVDDFLDIAKQMTKTDASGKPTQWGFYFRKEADPMYDWILLNGGRYTSPDGLKSMMSTPETKAGLQFLADLINKYKVCPTDTQALQFGDQAHSAIVAGKVAMSIGGLSFATGFDTANPKVEYILRPIPQGKKKVAHAFVNTWTIPKGAKNPDASWKVLELLSGKDGQQIALDYKMGLPASKEVDTAKFLAANAQNKYFIDSLAYALPFETPLNGADFYKIMKAELEPLWLNQKSVDEVTATIDAKAKDVLLAK